MSACVLRFVYENFLPPNVELVFWLFSRSANVLAENKTEGTVCTPVCSAARIACWRLHAVHKWPKHRTKNPRKMWSFLFLYSWAMGMVWLARSEMGRKLEYLKIVAKMFRHFFRAIGSRYKLLCFGFEFSDLDMNGYGCGMGLMWIIDSAKQSFKLYMENCNGNCRIPYEFAGFFFIWCDYERSSA